MALGHRLNNVITMILPIAVTCPNGMIYQECGTACPETCVNYADPPVCIEHCVEGCFCPPGQVLLRNSICVDVEACPRMFEYHEYSTY